MSAMSESPQYAEESSGFDLFPYMIVRIAGESFDHLIDLEIDRDGELLADVRAARAELDAARAVLSDETFRAVNGCTDGARRRMLLSLKRDLHNGRPLRTERLEQLATVGLASLSRYVAAAVAADRHLCLFEQTFEERRTAARERLQKIAGDESFRKPLMLASRALFDELPAYVAQSARSLSAKQLRVERAVVKYVTRAYAKTSPFSTFGHLALAESVDGEGPAWSSYEWPRFRSQVRITNTLWWRLRALLLAISEIRDRVPVRPNPTLRAAEDGYKFLRSALNVESFQTLPSLPELQQIAELAADSPAYGVLLRRLVGADVIEGDVGDVQAFLDCLIAQGFLDLDLGISGSDPDWAPRVVSLIEPVAPVCTAAAEVLAALKELLAQTKRFATAGVVDRDRILTECKARLNFLHEHLTAAVRDQQIEVKPPPLGDQRDLFYEDSAASGATIPLHERDIGPIVASLSDLTDRLAFSDGVMAERSQLALYCAAKYDASFVPLIQVYEDFYRDCKVPEQRRRRDAIQEEHFDYAGGAAVSAHLGAQRNAVRAWMACIASRLRNSRRLSTDLVELHPEDVSAAATVLPNKGEPMRRVSASAYLQLIPPASGDAPGMGVVNNVGPGYGKLMSRFLDMFPGHVTELLRCRNRTQDGFLLAELRDGTVGNADMHPPLLDFEIASPDAQTSFPTEKQILVSDLWVQIDRTPEPRLSLVRKSTGQPVEVIDLAFTALNFRARLFHLLVTGFSRARYVTVNPLLNAVAVAMNTLHRPASSGVRRNPRVVYDDRVVLQRASWSVEREALPVRESAESDASFYLRLNDWRQANGIPDHVFVYVTRDRDAIERDKATHRLSRDDYKPQFISFRDWFTVDLFDRMRARAFQSILIEEMLPSAESMLTFAGQRYATEFIVQWFPRS